MINKRTRSRTAAMAASLLAGGGFLMAGPGTGCSDYLVESAFVTADFCFIFDCQNGIFGGTIEPCSGNNPLFEDCPDGP